MKKKVSVIITTYKRAEHLERAILSVFNQTYNNIELIIVDDNNESSIYRSKVESLLEKYKESDNFIYVKHKQNKNGAAARNSGIRIASGNYIAFLDDDDVFKKTRLEELVIQLDKKENKDYGGIYSDVEIIYKNKKKYLKDISIRKSGNLKKELLLEEFTIGTGSNLFLRADVLNELQGFDERFKRHQDWEFLIRFFRISKLKYYDEILVEKYMDSRINYPNSFILEEVKNLYLTEFNDDIREYENAMQKRIVSNHIKELMLSCLNDARLIKAIKLSKQFRVKMNNKELCNYSVVYLKGIAKKLIKRKR